MNMEIGTEAARYPKNEVINGIFIAVYLMFREKDIFRMRKILICESNLAWGWYTVKNLQTNLNHIINNKLLQKQRQYTYIRFYLYKYRKI